MEIEPTIFYLVRHGESENNVREVLSSWPEKEIFHLTEKGRLQAKAAAEKLRDRGIARIYSSPVTRALETARIVSTEIVTEIIVDERLRETDFGIYDGGPVRARAEKYATDLDRIDTDGNELEGLRDVRVRIESFVADVMRTDAGKNIVVVSHGDPLELLRGVLRGQAIEESLLGRPPKNASVTEIVYDHR